MDSDVDKIIAVVGPTASGKTHRAVEIARHFGGEIISADSRQVYRRMNLGTGKDLDEYSEIPYHLIDICEPGEKYNLYRYLKDYSEAVDKIRRNDRRIVLCGGTGMYVEAALNGMKMPEVERNEELRSKLKGKTLKELTDILASMKVLHNTTDVDTVQRALRAIEIETYYNIHPEERPINSNNDKSRYVIVGIDIPRELRRENISRRLRQRLDKGMVEEVRELLDSGIPAENLIYYGLEYKWLTLYAIGSISYEEMVENLETAIHQFAKRQMTWFRGMERRGHKINWVPYDISTEELNRRIEGWMAS